MTTAVDATAEAGQSSAEAAAARESWSWVERVQSGDMEAFGLIYERYVDSVFRFVHFRVGHRQAAEDMTSEVFLRALKRIGSFTWQGRDLGAWLVTIARNLVADHFKSGRYRLEVTTGDVLDADREDRGPEGSPESAVVDHITNVALLTAVKKLRPLQQECIVLRFLKGYSVAEVAQAMRCNEGAIKALQYRAVRALARLVELDPEFAALAPPPPRPERPAPAPRHVEVEPVQAWAEVETVAPWPQPTDEPGVDHVVDDRPWLALTDADVRAWAREIGESVPQRGPLSLVLRVRCAAAVGVDVELVGAARVKRATNSSWGKHQ